MPRRSDPSNAALLLGAALACAIALFCAALLALSGCRPSPPPIPTPAPSSDAPACAAAAVTAVGQVCDGMFTAGGYACVRCDNVASCVDADLQVYCASGPCAGDQRCGFEPGRSRGHPP